MELPQLTHQEVLALLGQANIEVATLQKQVQALLARNAELEPKKEETTNGAHPVQ